MAHNGYAIRPLRPEAIERYRHLRLQGLEEHPDAFGETAEHFKSVTSEALVERLKSSEKLGGFILVAEDPERQFVGTVGLGVTDSEKTAHRSILWGMYIRPDARGTGLGRRLVEECLLRAKACHRLELVLLSVVTTNQAAFNLYKSSGFEVYGTDPAVLKIGNRYFDEYLMVKSLRG